MSRPTLGRHIAALEDALGHRLFTRSPDGLIPTSAAEALRPKAEAVAAAANALLRAASGLPGDDVGTIRITAAEVIAPIISDLQCRHPGIVVELLVTNRLQDLLRRDADIAIRMSPPQQDALLAKRIGEVDLGLFAAPKYLLRRRSPRTVEDLIDSHAIVSFDTPVPYTRTFQLEVFAPKVGMWLCMHEDQKTVPQCRLVFDSLADGLKVYVNS